MNTLLLTLVVSLGALPVEVTTLDDQTSQGTLVSLVDGKLQIADETGETTSFSAETLMSVRPTKPPQPPATKATVWVELVDGSQLQATGYRVSGRTATVKLLDGSEIELSTRSIRTAVFNPQDIRLKKQWEDIVASQPKGDAIVLRKKGRDEAGQEFLDYLEGVLYDVTPEAVQFEFDGDKIEVKRDKVNLEAFVYFHPVGRELPEVVCRVADNRGNVWHAKELKLADEQLQLATAAGEQIAVSLAGIERFDFSAGKIVFLSDLEPLKAVWQPFLVTTQTSQSAAQLFGYRRDQGFDGQPLSIDGKVSSKGIAMHSRTELVFRLPGEFRRLEAVAGIDENQRTRGHVRLQILGDERILLDEEIDGDDDPRDISLDISGAGRLTIVVDYGKGQDIGDRLNLGGARVIK